MRFSNLSWTRDARGFFYSRYPEPPKHKVLEAALSGQAIYYHRIGTPQSDDVLIYERPDQPSWIVGGAVTEDGRYLLITTHQGADNNNQLFFADLGDPLRPDVRARIRPLVESQDAEFAPIGNYGSRIYLRSDKDAPRRRVIAIDLEHPQPSAWKVVVPERAEVIESVALVGGRLVDPIPGRRAKPAARVRARRRRTAGDRAARGGNSLGNRRPVRRAGRVVPVQLAARAGYRVSLPSRRANQRSI